jgi:hypothetical protein
MDRTRLPDLLREVAGVAATSATGSTELRAMYGGLQAAIGTLALVATVRRDLERTALVALAFLAAGLFSARSCGVLASGGLSGYTIGALALESSLTVLSIWLLRDHGGAGGNAAGPRSAAAEHAPRPPRPR